MKLDAAQTEAVNHACASRFSLITGGAGTGKTTIIDNITKRLESNGESVALAAFAGKAAARVREACNHPASTIHRMLGYNGKQYMTDTLSDKSVVLDESSMIDSSLMSEIVKREPRRLVLVGDQAQLPPVGRAQPFHDLISLRPELVCNLRRCYRATEAVFKAATQIRNGERPPEFAVSDGEKWTMTNTGGPAQTQKKILEWVESGSFDFEQDIILTSRNGESDADPCTVRGLNKAITDIIAPRDEGVKFVAGNRVMNTKNLPDIDCWNGTTGTVHAVDQDGGVWVTLDVDAVIGGRKTSKVLFVKDRVKHLQLAYAITTHKSQGSQYRNVMLVGFWKDTHCLLDRALLYTAVTRTRKACCVVGELGAIYAAIGKQNHKNTVMQQLAAMK